MDAWAGAGVRFHPAVGVESSSGPHRSGAADAGGVQPVFISDLRVVYLGDEGSEGGGLEIGRMVRLGHDRGRITFPSALVLVNRTRALAGATFYKEILPMAA